MMTANPSLLQQLRQLGYRITPQREMIVDALAKAGDHVTAEEIFEVVKDRSSAVNIATVYRTLDTLVAEGLVCRTSLHGGQAVYVTQSHGAHIHLICRSCGAVIAVAEDVVLPLVEELENQHQFIADVQHLSILGTCVPCQKNTTGSKESEEEN